LLQSPELDVDLSGELRQKVGAGVVLAGPSQRADLKGEVAELPLEVALLPDKLAALLDSIRPLIRAGGDALRMIKLLRRCALAGIVLRQVPGLGQSQSFLLP
jgi:hypothetical protein